MFIHGDDAYDLGHTLAGWTGMAVGTLGSAVCGLGVITASGTLALVGAGLLLVALLITWALHLAGWGKPSGPRPAEQWDWRVRDTGARAGHPDCLGCRLAGRHGRTHGTGGAESVRAATVGWTTQEAAEAEPSRADLGSGTVTGAGADTGSAISAESNADAESDADARAHVGTSVSA